MSQESFNIETIRKYHQDITNLKKKYHEKKLEYKNACNKLPHTSTGASSFGVISKISTTGTAFTVVRMPVSASLDIVSTISISVGGILLLLTSEKYNNKLFKCCELIDKITSSLATFEALISLSLSDDSVIDAKELHKLQALYLQVMAGVRNVDKKIKVQMKENFENSILDEIKNINKNSFCMLFNCLYYKNNEE